MQAPTLPVTTLGYQPQRPYTLDLTSPPTPAESGISTAGSSYRSFSSTDQGLQDHAPLSSMDSGPTLFSSNYIVVFYYKQLFFYMELSILFIQRRFQISNNPMCNE